MATIARSAFLLSIVCACALSGCGEVPEEAEDNAALIDPDGVLEGPTSPYLIGYFAGENTNKSRKFKLETAAGRLATLRKANDEFVDGCRGFPKQKCQVDMRNVASNTLTHVAMQGVVRSGIYVPQGPLFESREQLKRESGAKFYFYKAGGTNYSLSTLLDGAAVCSSKGRLYDRDTIVYANAIDPVKCSLSVLQFFQPVKSY